MKWKEHILYEVKNDLGIFFQIKKSSSLLIRPILYIYQELKRQF